MGATLTRFESHFLAALPLYLTRSVDEIPEAAEFVDAARQASAFLIASPGWHGSVSGSIKNALDYLEETAGDARPYFDQHPVGLIATAYGWQAAGTTLTAMRTIIHALRGWPTPLGVANNCSQPIFEHGKPVNAGVAAQLR